MSPLEPGTGSGLVGGVVFLGMDMGNLGGFAKGLALGQWARKSNRPHATIGDDFQVRRGIKVGARPTLQQSTELSAIEAQQLGYIVLATGRVGRFKSGHLVLELSQSRRTTHGVDNTEK